MKFPAIPTEVWDDGTPIYGRVSEGSFRGVLSEPTDENREIVEWLAVSKFGDEFGISKARRQEAAEHIGAFIKQEDHATYTDFDEPGPMQREAWGGRDYPFLEVGVNRTTGPDGSHVLPLSTAVVAGVVLEQIENKSIYENDGPQHTVYTAVPFEFGRSASAEDLEQVVGLLSGAYSSAIEDYDPRQVAEKLDPRMVALLAQAAERARPGDDEAVEQVDHDSFHDYLVVQHVPNKKDIQGNRWTGLYRLDLETYLRSVIRKEFESAPDEGEVPAKGLSDRMSVLDALVYREFRTGFEEWRATQNTQRLGQTAVEG